jgi:hypothetical protein
MAPKGIGALICHSDDWRPEPGLEPARLWKGLSVRGALIARFLT